MMALPVMRVALRKLLAHGEAGDVDITHAVRRVSNPLVAACEVKVDGVE
jgi:hypothetical protein